MDRKWAEEKAAGLVDKMTVEEMASQLRYDAPAIKRLGIPEYNWWNEGLHGVARGGTATVFPQAIGLGATFDKKLLFDIGECISVEARAKYNEASRHDDRDIYKGITIWSPNVNLFRDPRWGRGQETYGEDPCLISKLAVPFIGGLQGDGKILRTAACAKHFAVHSGPEAERHFFDAKATLKDMWETYLPAFEACVTKADVESVMGAYNRTNGEPCCASEYLMNTVLRGKWKFKGHYVSDCWAVRDFHEQHGVTKTAEESATLALTKGCDVNCGCTYQRVMNAYKQGKLPLEYIRRSAVRLFTTRYLLGMFDENEYDNIPYEVVDCKEHKALTEKAAAESIVLLKNNGILPLKKDEIRTIGVVGPNADSRNALIGNYHGTASQYFTVLDGIQNIAGDDMRVLYAKGAHLFKNREEDLAKSDDRIAEAVTVAEHSDVVVVCLGLDETLEGEEGDTGNAYSSGDKKTLQYPLPQRNLLKALIATKKPLIVCSMTGSAMDMCEIDASAAAVLQTWYPGARGGKVIAEILFGQKEPTGKLPITIYKDIDGMPDFKDYSMKGRTYRFLEKEPLYPFGYGLHYGKLEIKNCKLAERISYQELPEKQVKLCVEISNMGTMQTEDVLQIYTHVLSSEMEVRNPKLAEFERISLEQGETKQVEITLDAASFTTVDEQGERNFDGSGANIYVGFGQPDQRTKGLLGSESFIVSI